MPYRHLCSNVYHKLKINYLPLFRRVLTTTIPPSNNPILPPAFHGLWMVPQLIKAIKQLWESLLNLFSFPFPMLNPLPNMVLLNHESLQLLSFFYSNTTFPESVSHVSSFHHGIKSPCSTSSSSVLQCYHISLGFCLTSLFILLLTFWELFLPRSLWDLPLLPADWV